jgi:hypothetical protein
MSTKYTWRCLQKCSILCSRAVSITTVLCLLRELRLTLFLFNVSVYFCLKKYFGARHLHTAKERNENNQFLFLKIQLLYFLSVWPMKIYCNHFTFEMRAYNSLIKNTQVNRSIKVHAYTHLCTHTCTYAHTYAHTYTHACAYTHKFRWHSSQKCLRIFFYFHRKIQKTPPQTVKEILSKEQCWRFHNARLQTTLQRHSNKDGMIQALKQTHGAMEQNTGHRIQKQTRTTTATWFSTNTPKTYVEKETVSLTSGARKKDIHL